MYKWLGEMPFVLHNHLRTMDEEAGSREQSGEHSPPVYYGKKERCKVAEIEGGGQDQIPQSSPLGLVFGGSHISGGTYRQPKVARLQTPIFTWNEQPLGKGVAA